MTISATAVRFDDDTMWVDLTDGRTLGVPLAWVSLRAQAASDFAPHHPGCNADLVVAAGAGAKLTWL